MNKKNVRFLIADWPVNLSFDKSNQKIEGFYSSIDGAIVDKNSIFYNKRQVDIFLLAMALGKEYNQKKKIKQPSMSIRRDAITEEEAWIMCSIVLADEKDLNKIADGKTVADMCEQYANGGMESLMGLDGKLGDKTEHYENALESALKKMPSVID